jgi:hypothetical protein
MRAAGSMAMLALAAGLSAGCEVVNPGPVADEYMTLPTSQQGFVNGAMERLVRVVGYGAYYLALPAREIFPGGQTGSYGANISQQAGNFGGTPEWNASGTGGVSYNTAQQARWVAEEAIRQFELRGDVSPAIMVQAYTWAGFANRILGDHWCYGAIDGGPLIPGSDYHRRASDWFTKAIAIAPNDATRYMALAGRAQTRLWLEDFTGAIADARLIPLGYSAPPTWRDGAVWLEMDFSKGGNVDQRNHVQWANSNSPYRSWTVRYTDYDEYFTQTGDPRTPWTNFAAAPDRQCVGSLQGYPGGKVPCTLQTRYLSQDDDIRIASAAEMRLIEAEALLAQSDANWQQALTLINDVRTSYTSVTTRQPLAPYTATNAAETWTVLKRERGYELWLEGRRMADLRRWQPLFGPDHTASKWPRGGVGGPQGHPDLPNFESRMSNPTNNIFTQYPRGRPQLEGGAQFPRELCFNISNQEANTNPNIPDREDEP